MDNLWGVTLEDLKVAVNAGWKFHGGVQHGWSFVRGSCNIWKTKNKWQTAEIDNHKIFVNHKDFDKLQDALRREW